LKLPLVVAGVVPHSWRHLPAAPYSAFFSLLERRNTAFVRARRNVDNRLAELVASFGSFRVTLRSEPSHLSVAAHPIVNIGFAGKAADDPDFGVRDRCLNLPIGFSDPLWLEYDARRFFHPGNMTPNRADS
jgi:hypothetical protein